MNDINSLLDWLHNKFNKDLPDDHLLNCAFLLNIIFFDKYNEYIIPDNFEMIDDKLTYALTPKDHIPEGIIQKDSDLDKKLHQLFVFANMYEDPKDILKKVLSRFPIHEQ